LCELLPIARRPLRPAEARPPEIFDDLTKAPATNHAAARNAIWLQIDRQVMAGAVILPGVYGKALPYATRILTNVYVHQYCADYDYANVGLK